MLADVHATVSRRSAPLNDQTQRKAFRLTEQGRHVSTVMTLYATGDMTRRVSAPSETESWEI